ncbi:hypothetical protein HIM_05560 [Hirsutella minnesotensis 3608]|uniref:ATP synthase subunit 5, mitochondrial n=1 Tax=Hirsutella minnesotensis 3608 TaxID=1043627 RepID=A0A0F8A5C2_9HYPO|nr:hypothetical protein HIM_05560 [Hirsutella minnesotensis 3608]
MMEPILKLPDLAISVVHELQLNIGECHVFANALKTSAPLYLSEGGTEGQSGGFDLAMLRNQELLPHKPTRHQLPKLPTSSQGNPKLLRKPIHAPEQSHLAQTRPFSPSPANDRHALPTSLPRRPRRRAPACRGPPDGTYATALYTAASKSSTLDPTARAIASLGNAVEKDAKLLQILSMPTLTPKDKEAIVTELAKLAGGRDETVKNFLETLAENNRLGLLQGVCAKFGEIMSAARGEVEMTVTSAQPLDNRTLSRLETAVAKSSYVGQGKKLKVTNSVNSDIVGGLVVEVGDRTIDLSVSSRIAKMNKLLTDNL